MRSDRGSESADRRERAEHRRRCNGAIGVLEDAMGRRSKIRPPTIRSGDKKDSAKFDAPSLSPKLVLGKIR